MAELESELGLHTSVGLFPSFSYDSSVTSTNVFHRSVHRRNTKIVFKVISDVLGDKARTPSKPTLPSSLSSTKTKFL